MALQRFNQFPEGSGSLSNDDIFLFMDDPSNGGITKKISLSQISNAIGGGGGGGNPFDQNLNSTDSPTFNFVSLSNITTGIIYADGTTQNSANISSANITNFNSSVSGLLPVKNIVAGSGISLNSNSGSFTINTTALISNPSGITGATAITNIVQISQSDFDNIPTPDPNTLYVINS